MRLNKTIYKHQASGSITVFLTLILLLVLSLLLTITEGARISTAKVYAKRSLSTAMDSVLAEYYGPLWEEYHIFGYNSESEDNSIQREKIAQKLIDYMSYTLEPDKNLSISGGGSFELYNTLTKSVSVDNETLLMDYQGQLLINEAVEYMKYREIGNGVEQLLDKLSLLETPQKVSYLYEEKQKVDKELVEIDKGILELMELLDGLKTGKNGIEVTKAGDLQYVNYFVKKICLGKITSQLVGINQENIFQALKNSYVNPLIDFESINKNFTDLEQIIKNMGDAYAEKVKASEELLTEQTKLDKLNAMEKKTKEDKQQIKEVKKTIKTLKEKIEAFDREVREQDKLRLPCVSSICNSKDSLLQLMSGMKPVLNEAITAIDTIILKQKTAGPILEQYEKLLYKNQESIDKDTFGGLEENLKEMKKYIVTEENSYDFKGMKVILEKDIAVLTQVENLMKQGDTELSLEQYQAAKDSYQTAKDQTLQYQIEGLTLDYSTLVLEKSTQENPLNAVNNLLQSGITNMIIDPNDISEGQLTQGILPSEIAALSQGDKNYLTMLTEFFAKAATGESSTGGIFGSFGDISQMMSFAGDGVNKLTEHLLYQEYIKEHFMRYNASVDSAYSNNSTRSNKSTDSINSADSTKITDSTESNDSTKSTDSNNSSTQKPSVLTYEQEYLLVGKSTDPENLSSVISRIVLLRTILDFASILGDSVKRNEAKLVAAALVGFTGLPILVAVTQVLILLVWAFAEALLDVNALILGKEVSVIKKKIVLEFPELFIINRSFLQTKAKAFTTTKELSLSYQDYLRLFLMMKSKQEVAYRSMDLMQENIKIRYDEGEFDITDCVFGFDVTADYTVPSKFTSISIVQKYLNISKKGFDFTTKAAYSY